jgi:FSR family fosmidomycin resistance protein-like MFS transporter
MALLLDALFNSVAYGHMIVDVLNGQRTVLFTYWSQVYGMTNTSLAIISSVYVWVASLSQPFFGWVSDRFGKARLLAGGGILWMTVFFASALFLPVQWAIPCLVLGSLGSAAFHPVGTMQSILRGRTLLAGRETTSTSWFFVFGQMGYFIGPIVGGILLQAFGPPGVALLAIPALLIGLNAFWRLRHAVVLPRPASGAVAQYRLSSGKFFLIALAIIASLQAWAQQNMIVFIPKYLSDLGQPASVYGWMAGLFMGGSAIGNVIGGTLADRYGRRRVAVGMLLVAAIPIFLLSLVGWSWTLYLLIPLSGMFTGAVHSIIVVLAQRAIGGGMALASGLTLGFMFSAGALGTLLSGSLADAWGIPHIFQLTAGLVIMAALFTLFLKERKA